MEIKTKISRCLNAWNSVDVAKQIVEKLMGLNVRGYNDLDRAEECSVSSNGSAVTYTQTENTKLSLQ